MAAHQGSIFIFLLPILVTACRQFLGKRLHLSLFALFCPTLQVFFNLLVELFLPLLCSTLLIEMLFNQNRDALEEHVFTSSVAGRNMN